MPIFPCLQLTNKTSRVCPALMLNVVENSTEAEDWYTEEGLIETEQHQNSVWVDCLLLLLWVP